MSTKHKTKIRKGDTVEIISGVDKGKRGKVLTVLPKEGKIVVENVNTLTKHQKPAGMGQPGGIIHAEGAIYTSKAMVVCEACDKPSRIGTKVLDDGSKVRVCRKCGETYND